MDNRPEIEEGSYFQKIHASSGVKFLNQLHARSFSLNIFQMNALELMEATRKVRDPEQGLSLMSQDNKEAGQQAHRELSRHVHNFVASAKTLVDHTRVFIEEHYADTTVLSSYKDQITSTFANEPVSKFVHDLRNYMLHKGLPNSHMFMYFEQDPEKPERGAELTTGIRLDTESLLEWSGWTAPAKQYIESAGEYINIHQFSEEYLVRVNRFHSWLEALLHEHHATDLAELAKLQELYTIETTNEPKTQVPNSIILNVAPQTPLDVPFTFSAEDAAAINEMSDTLLSKVREITVPASSPDEFPTQRPISASLTDADMIETPIFRGHDANGNPVIIFIRTDRQLFGLAELDFADAEDIADKIHTTRWARDKLSREFIQNELLVWVRSNFRTQNRNSFSSTLIEKSLREVAVLEVWAPIAHLEVESQLEFGSVKISPITSEKIDSLKQMGPEIPPDQKEAVRELFANMRKELQGFAAVVITLEAEPLLASEKGLMIAQDAISLLRFFSPAAPVSRALCPTALLGAEIVPHSKLLVLSDSSFSMTDKISSRNIAFWKLPQRGLKQLEAMGFKQAGSLVSPAGLSDFAASVRSSLITYGKGTTFPDLIDRLTHALSALEGVFLRHSMEPVESNIADRISFVLSKQESERAEIAQNIRQAYRQKGQYRTSPLSPREQEILARFVFNAHVSLQIALQNVASFQTKAEFIAAVELLGVTPSAL